MIKENIIIIYHANCPDGFGGAYAAWKKFGKKAAYIPLGYGDPLPPGLKNKEIYLVDFSLSKSTVMELVEKNRRVTGIDHHASNENDTKATQEYSFSLKHSGAVLAWKYFHPKKAIPIMMKYVEAIDMGKFHGDASAASVLLESYSFDFKVWDKLREKFDKPAMHKKMLEQGNAILAYENYLIGTIVQSAQIVKFEGKKMYSVQIPKLPINFKSKIGRALAETRYGTALLWRETNDGLIACSLRSKSANIAKIAQKYGGGGHKLSAGFALNAKKTLPWKIVDSPRQKG